MFLRPITRSTWRLSSSTLTRHSSTHHKPAPFPTIPSCPSPTCACADTPAMPEGLEIDHSRSLNGTMAAYAEQVLICTGKDDWPSRIEEENSGDNLAADLKELMGRGGIYSDPYHNVSIANTSLPSTVPQRSEIQSASAYLLPSFKYIEFLPRISFDAVQALVKGYLLPARLHPAHDVLSPIHRDRLLRSETHQRLLPGVQDVEDILVLICGHGGRDQRCGITGPVLRGEFEEKLPGKRIRVLKGAVEGTGGTKVHPVRMALPGAVIDAAAPGDPVEMPVATARVGLISHIGGHKFAGNVILYMPPGLKDSEGKKHALAGCGIWYGRVEPKHVEGIIQETLREGKVIADLFRGGIRQGGEILRL